MPVKEERSGWREHRISARHREWGFNCPAVDIDFLVVEYHFGRPAALIEYKRFDAAIPNLKHPTYRALSELADGVNIPFVIVFYWPKTWAFQAYPVNQKAREHFAWGEEFSEKTFVAKLYLLRQCVLEKSLKDRLNTEYPPVNSVVDWEDKENPFE